MTNCEPAVFKAIVSMTTKPYYVVPPGKPNLPTHTTRVAVVQTHLQLAVLDPQYIPSLTLLCIYHRWLSPQINAWLAIVSTQLKLALATTMGTTPTFWATTRWLQELCMEKRSWLSTSVCFPSLNIAIRGPATSNNSTQRFSYHFKCIL